MKHFVDCPYCEELLVDLGRTWYTIAGERYEGTLWACKNGHSALTSTHTDRVIDEDGIEILRNFTGHTSRPSEDNFTNEIRKITYSNQPTSTIQ